MGFALWIDRERAWARGTQEYRAMGVAVIAATDLFRPRDFRPSNCAPAPGPAGYEGLFASVGDLNRHLLARRRPWPQPPRARAGKSAAGSRTARLS